MQLPVMPPLKPMLAKATKTIPSTDSDGAYIFEPKWDGFRCLIFKDGDEVELASRNTKPLGRYFPELLTAVRDQLPEKCVLDGEIFLAQDGQLDFETLQARVHPAESRIQMLSEETPAEFVAFDLLALGKESYLERPLRERREALVATFASVAPPLHATRVTDDPVTAQRWFEEFEGAGFDGVMAKDLGSIYAPDKRLMLKIKHARTADVVLAGYRLHKKSTPETPLLGSLLLALYAGEELCHIGVAASFTAARRAELIEELSSLVCDIAEHPWASWGEWAVANPDRAATTSSRWSAGKDLSFTPLRPTRVLEVGYDHMEGRRFRHTAQFKRWRPDRDPKSCGYDQLEQPERYDLAKVLL